MFTQTSKIPTNQGATGRIDVGPNDCSTNPENEFRKATHWNWLTIVIIGVPLLIGGLTFWIWWMILELVTSTYFNCDVPVMAYLAGVLVYAFTAMGILTLKSRRTARQALPNLEQRPLKDRDLQNTQVEFHTYGRHKKGFAENLRLALVFIPLWLLSIPICLPFAGVVFLLTLICESRFRSRMRNQGRYLLWQEAIRRIEASEGTLIVAWYDKGLSFWWTAEDIVAVSPHPVPHDREESIIHDDMPFTAWCQERYLNLDHGTAYYTELPRKARRRWPQSLPQIRVVYVQGGWVSPRGATHSHDRP